MICSDFNAHFLCGIDVVPTSRDVHLRKHSATSSALQFYPQAEGCAVNITTPDLVDASGVVLKKKQGQRLSTSPTLRPAE